MSPTAGPSGSGASERRKLPMFPLSAVLFPGSPLSLHVFEPRYRQLVQDCLQGAREFGIVLIARGSEVGGNDERLMTGTLATIEGISALADGQYGLVVRGDRRIRIHNWLIDDPYPLAEIEELSEQPTDSAADVLSTALGAVRRARALLSELNDAPPLPSDFMLPISTDEHATQSSWLLCSLAPLDAFDRQSLLEAPTLEERLALLTSLCNDLGDDIALMLAQESDS